MNSSQLVGLLVTFAWAGGVVSGAEADASAVSIDGNDLQSYAGIPAWDGHLRLHPKILAAAGYDNNPRSTAVKEPSSMIRIGGGLDAMLSFDATTTLTLRSEAVHLEYPSLHDADLDSYLVNLRLAHFGATWDTGLEGGLIRLNDPLPETGERIPRLVADVVGDLALNGPTVRVGVAMTATQTRYLEDSRDFTAADRDNSAFSLSGWMRTPNRGQLNGYLQTIVDRRLFNTDMAYNDAAGVAMLAGVDGHLADKVTLRLLAGPQWRQYADNFRSNPSYDDRRTLTWAADGSIAWDFAERWDLQIGGRRLLDDGIRANSVTLLLMRSDVGWRVSERVRVGIGFDQERATDSGSAAGTPINRRVTHLWHTTVTWRPRPSQVIELRVYNTRSTSIVDDDYTRVVGGLRFAATL